MLAAMQNNIEVALQAVRALYRQQTKDEQRTKDAIYSNGHGFNKANALRYMVSLFPSHLEYCSFECTSRLQCATRDTIAGYVTFSECGHFLFSKALFIFCRGSKYAEFLN